MAYEDRSYSSAAVKTTLTANITNTSTTIPIAASTGWPDGTGGPFHVAIAPVNDPTAFSEVIRCSGRTGLNLNVQTTPDTGRGWDQTTAAAHLTGAIIAHVVTKTDLEEANQHIFNTALDHHSQYITIARHDLPSRHGISSLPVGGTPSSSVVGDTASSGTSSLLPRSDHKHAREGFGTPVRTGSTLSQGFATSIARSDHVHTDAPIICTSTTRPDPAWEGLVIHETDTKRIRVYTSTNIWHRVGNYQAAGKTGFSAGRSAVAIPTGGLTTYLTWDSESYDSDDMVNSSGTVTDIKLPLLSEVGGLWALTIRGQWSTIFSQRSYAEIHLTGVEFFRVVTTGDDFFALTATVIAGGGAVFNVGVHQESGVSQNVSMNFTGYKLLS